MSRARPSRATAALATAGSGGSMLRSLDPRALLVATLAFIVVVVSFGPRELSALVPLAAFPTWMAASAGVSVRSVARRLLVASPFVLAVAAPSLWLDPRVELVVGGIGVTAGMLEAGSIVLRFVLTVSAVVVLVSAVGIPSLGSGLRRLGVPAVLVVQLLLLDRYVGVVAAEATRMLRARQLRSGGRASGLRASYASIVGHLLLRSLDRTSRIHDAMRCRGFAGDLPSGTERRFGTAEWLFLLVCGSLFAAARALDLPEQFERWLLAFARTAVLGPSVAAGVPPGAAP